VLLWEVDEEYDGYGEADSVSCCSVTTLIDTVMFKLADTLGTDASTLIVEHVAPDRITI
jgi:hypothetical protein